MANSKLPHGALVGAEAVEAVAAQLGRSLTLIERRVVEEEGYVPNKYLDSKGIVTFGVGQTGEWIDKGFPAALEAHVERARGRIPNYDKLPEALQAELVQAEYRGDLGISPKFVKLINAEKWDAAALEFADNNEYRSSRAGNGAIANRMDKVSAAVTAHGQTPAPVAAFEPPTDGLGPVPADVGVADVLETPAAPLPRQAPQDPLEFTEPDLPEPTVAQPRFDGTLNIPRPAPLVRPVEEDFVEPELPEAIVQLPTIAESKAFEAIADQKADEHGWWDMMGRSFESDNGIAHIGQWLDTEGAIYDPSFDVTTALSGAAERVEVINQIGDAEEIGDILGRAVSDEHFEALLSGIERQRESEQMFAEAGLKGFSARILPMMLDLDTAVGLVTGGIGNITKFTKLGAILKGAAGAGATNAMLEGIAAVDNPYRDSTDVMWAFGTGMILGGPLGLLSTKGNKALRELSEASIREDMAYEAARSAVNVAAKNGDTGSARAALDAAGREFNDEGRILNDLELAPSSSERAGEISDKAGDPGKFGYMWANVLQRNYIGRLFNNANETIRNIAPRILEGGILIDKKATRAFTAEGRMNNFHQTATTRMFTQTQQDFKEWAEINKFGTIQREIGIEANEKFYTEVGLAMQGNTHMGDGITPISSQAKSSAAKMKVMMDEVHAAAREQGLPGFDGDPLENFFPRHWDQSKLSKTFEDLDDESIQAWFKGSIMEEFETNPRPEGFNLRTAEQQAADAEELTTKFQEVDARLFEADDAVASAEATLAGFKPRQKGIGPARKATVEAKRKAREVRKEQREVAEEVRQAEAPADELDALADRIATGFLKGIRRNHAGLDTMLQRGIDLDDADLMADLFDGLDDSIADTLRARIERMNEAGTGDAGNIRHGRNRLRISETFQGKVTLRDGTTRNMSLDDMTLTDAGKVLPRYFRTMGGWIGLAKEAGIKGQRDVNALATKMAVDGAHVRDIEAFQDSIKLVTGRSVADNPNGIGDQAGRLLAAWDYTRFGGSFGVAQIPELGRILGEVGILNFIKGIPEFASLVRRAADGTLDSRLAREMEELIAPGTDFTIGHSRANFDEHGLGFTNDVVKKADSLLARGGRLTSVMSFMAPINTALERIATSEIVVNWGRFADGTKKVSKAKAARLREAGLSDADQKAVFAAIKKHGTYEDGRLKAINSDEWDGPTLDKFRMAVDRTRRSTIQRNDIGNTGKYIHNPLGKAMTRFQNFMLNSINKQLIHGIHHRDIQTFVSFSTSMFLGAMAYTAQTSIDYANDPEKRRERLTPTRIAAAGYSRAGFSAITIPIIDSSLALFGRDQVFNYGRTSGLGTDIVSGNTSLVGAEDVLMTATLPLRLLMGDNYSFSGDDLDRIQRLVPLQRVLGIRNGFKAIEDGFNLPKTSQRQ